MAIDVVIPARNEEKTIAGIVEVWKSHPVIYRVIVAVDDDSRDDTYNQARYAGALAVQTQARSNKGMVVACGLNYVVPGDHVIFSDADLEGLTYNHVSEMCAMIQEVPRGLVLGVPDPPVGNHAGHIYWAWPWVTGTRGMPRDFVREIPLHGYLMETQINKAARAHSMPIVYQRLYGLVSPYKMTEKRREEMERDRAYGIKEGILP